jgi:hypothetical protein
MIRGRIDNTVFLGLDREDINRLLDNKPIFIHAESVGIRKLTIVILAGETYEDLKENLRDMGIKVNPLSGM